MQVIFVTYNFSLKQFINKYKVNSKIYFLFYGGPIDSFTHSNTGTVWNCGYLLKIM